MDCRTRLAVLLASPATLLAFLAELQAVDPSLLFARAIDSSCSIPYAYCLLHFLKQTIDPRQQDVAGSCQATSSWTTGGFNLVGYCPNDPTNVQCYVSKTCTTSSDSGMCMNTADTCSGKFVAGACPGPSTVQVWLRNVPRILNSVLTD